MSYKITKGLPKTELSQWLRTAAKSCGTFADGRVDYTNAKIAPIVMCTIVYKNRILLVKRGFGLADAEGYWSTVNGFIDEDKPVEELARQELREELGLDWTYTKLSHPRGQICPVPNSFSSFDVSVDTSPSDKTVFTRSDLPWERAILGRSSRVTSNSNYSRCFIHPAQSARKKSLYSTYAK